MLRPYRDVLALPGARAFVAAGFLARLPISMLGIGIVLLVSATSGAYAIAGTVAAVFGLVQAVSAPRVARLVDRFGQGRVLRPAVSAHAGGLLALIAFAQAGAPTWTLLGSAAVAGAAMGSVGSLVRARWTHVLAGDPPRLHAAFSLESVLDEVVFIVGPVLVTLLATRVAPSAGLLVAAAAALVGSLLLATLRSTEPPGGTRAGSGPGRPPLTHPGMAVLVVAFVFVGCLFASVEVITVAFTQERGRPAAAGLVLAAFALGSLIAGVGYGAITWRAPAGRRFGCAVVVLAAGVLPLGMVTTIPALAVVTFLAGFGISPMLIAGNGLVQEVVAPSRLTEGFTWVATALGIGGSVGAAVAGWLVDSRGPRAAFLLSTGAALLAATTALAGTRWLRAGSPAEPAPPGQRSAPGAEYPTTAAGHLVRD